MLKYKASSAKCRLFFITLQADSQLWGKSSGIWAKMSSVYEYVAFEIIRKDALIVAVRLIF